MAWVAIDVHQLWTAAQAEYGVGSKIDFLLLSQFFHDDKDASFPWMVNAYLPDKIFQKDDKFKKVLQHLSFAVKEVPSYTIKQYSRSPAAVQIAVDALQQTELHTRFVFVSGNGDLIPVVKYLRDKNKIVEVWSFREDTAGDLLKCASNIKFLSKEHLYVTPPKIKS